MNFKDNPVINFYSRLSQTGVDDTTPATVRKYVVLTNNIILTALTLIPAHILIFYLLRFPWFAFVLEVLFVLYLFFLYLNSKKLYSLSRTFLIFTLNASLAAFAVSFGKDSGLHLLYFVFVSIPFLLYELKHYFQISFSILGSIIPFFVVRFQLIHPLVNASPFALDILLFTMTCVTFFWLLLNMLYLVRSNVTSENKLIENNGLLAQEVSTRKEAEKKLQHYNLQLKLKNRELEQFTYVASHDLQEPLRTITSYADLLDKEYANTLDERGHKFLKYVLSSSQRMKKLITDLLDYSRIGRHQTMETVDCNILLQEVLDDMASSIAENKVQIQFSNLPMVSAFASNLKMLFQNLLGNAIKFHKPGVLPVISIGIVPDETYWKFVIEDNGIGIEEKFQENIFAIFNRLHVRSEYEGNGIGLAHCKKIAELHEGTIWVESKPGEGSKFYFTIPK